MYFRWKDRRIVVKLAVWGATEGRAAPFVHTLADAATDRVDAGELPTPDEGGAVGLPRNAEAVAVDEPNRKFTLFVSHPSGEAGTFRETPVDYKLVAPESPVEGNEAFDSVLHDASGVIFIASGESSADAAALRAVAEGAESTTDQAHPPLRILLPPEGSDAPDPAAFEGAHEFPADAVVERCRTWNADDAWGAFLATARQVRPRLQAASDRGALPV